MVKESSWLYYLDHKYICLTCLTTLIQQYSHQGLPEVFWGPFQILQGFTNYYLLQLAAALASAALAWYSANLNSSLRSAESYVLRRGCETSELWNFKLWNAFNWEKFKFDQVEGKVNGRKRCSPVFQLWPEVPDKTLDWPGSAVSQSADGVALNLKENWKYWYNDPQLENMGLHFSELYLFAQFPYHINLLWLRVALSEPPHHCVHPVNTLERTELKVSFRGNFRLKW